MHIYKHFYKYIYKYLYIYKLSFTSYLSSAQKVHVATGNYIGQHRCRIFLWWQEVLLDSTPFKALPWILRTFALELLAWKVFLKCGRSNSYLKYVLLICTFCLVSSAIILRTITWQVKIWTEVYLTLNPVSCFFYFCKLQGSGSRQVLSYVVSKANVSPPIRFLCN